MKKFVPEGFEGSALDRLKSELTDAESQLKAAKLEAREKDKKDATADTAGTNLLAADDYSKYSANQANQHGGPSGGSSAGGSSASQYMKEYASAYAKYANA